MKEALVVPTAYSAMRQEFSQTEPATGKEILRHASKPCGRLVDDMIYPCRFRVVVAGGAFSGPLSTLRAIIEDVYKGIGIEFRKPRRMRKTTT